MHQILPPLVVMILPGKLFIYFDFSKVMVWDFMGTLYICYKSSGGTTATVRVFTVTEALAVEIVCD